MAATVYMTDLSAGWKKNVPSKVYDLFGRLDPDGIFHPRDLVAIKLHFGKAGSTAYIQPQYVSRVVDLLKAMETRPFLTDTNTLYVGSRAEAYSHMTTAFDHGFTREVTGAPVIIADGLRGNNVVRVQVTGPHLQEAHIASGIHNADGLMVPIHFKDHELAGFGGALKNIGMGCAARTGKPEQHSDVSPKVKMKKCVGC